MKLSFNDLASNLIRSAINDKHGWANVWIVGHVDPMDLIVEFGENSEHSVSVFDAEGDKFARELEGDVYQQWIKDNVDVKRYAEFGIEIG